MRWPEDLDGWPHSEVSRRVLSRPHQWHVQDMGEGPTLLLLHGAGGASHSWRDVMPILAQSHHVVAIDLPGHGLTKLGGRMRSSLDAMTEDIASLCAKETWQPVAVIGHSAGGAIAVRLSQRHPDRFASVMGINAALAPFSGLAGLVFPAMAKLLAITPFTADFFSRSARQPERVAALIDSTGSKLNAEGMRLYQALVADRDHVDGTLNMMAQWSLDALFLDVPNTHSPMLFLTGSNDQTVKPKVSKDIAQKLPNAAYEEWPSLGHLMHEEAPERVAARIREWAATQD